MKTYYCKRYEKVDRLLGEDEEITRDLVLEVDHILRECVADILKKVKLNDWAICSFHMYDLSLTYRDDEFYEDIFNYKMKLSDWIKQWVSLCKINNIEYLNTWTKVYLENYD